ncbi:MAG: hypothetical protein J5I47_02405 [Vicingus serpentipes]|nr:hypothetical protein [Vicingus serpentipes]
MFEFKNKTILILSPEDWGENLLSKHLYAQELSKNNKVYFVHTVAHPTQKELVSLKIISSNLNIVHLKKVAKGLFKLPSFLIDFQNSIILKKMLKVLPIKTIDVVWSFDQSKFQNLHQFNATVKIFHPVDFIPKAKPFLNRIANTADVVFSVSELILDEIKTTSPKYFINHGLDELFITRDIPIHPPSFINPEKINVGYVGNLQMKLIDWDNLVRTIKENPTINFVFIGPDKASNIGGSITFGQLDVIKKMNNTFFTGVLSKSKLQQTLHFFDAFLMCYNDKKFPIQVSNSHKILEYLSTGKTIISYPIFTYKNSNLIEIVNENHELPERVHEIANTINEFNSNEKKEMRIAYAKNNSYPQQIKRIEHILSR